MGARAIGRIAALTAAGILVASTCDKRPEPDLWGTDPDARYRGALEVEDASPEIMARLLELLEDPHPMPRQGAVVALGRLRRPPLYVHIRPRLADRALDVQLEACRAAAQLGNPDAIPDLAQILAGRQASARLRRQAVTSLASFGRRPEVLMPLIQALSDDPEFWRRQAGRGVESETSVIRAAYQELVSLTGRTGTSPLRSEWLHWYEQEHGPGGPR